jgi:hypothetical protein
VEDVTTGEQMALKRMLAQSADQRESAVNEVGGGVAVVRRVRERAPAR